MAEFNLSYSADQVDTALRKVVNQDLTPTSGSDNTVSSNGVFTHVAQQVDAVDKTTEVDDHETRITVLESVTSPVSYGYKSGLVDDNSFITNLDTVSSSESVTVTASTGRYTVNTGYGGDFLVRLFGDMTNYTTANVSLYKNGTITGGIWLDFDSDTSQAGYRIAAERCLSLNPGDYLQLYQNASNNPNLDKLGIRIERLG